MSISHADFGGTTGHYVRVTRSGETHSKFFKRKKDAVKYERVLLARLGPPQSQKGTRKGPVKSNTGIRRIVETANRHGSPCFRVYWRTPEGQPRSSEVSIFEHGRTKALRLARRVKREKDAACED